MVPIDTVSVAHVAIGAGRAALPDAAAAPPFFILFSHPRRRTLRTSPQPPDGDQNGGENRAYCKSSNRFAEKRRSLASVTRHPSVMTAERSAIDDQRSTINDRPFPSVRSRDPLRSASGITVERGTLLRLCRTCATEREGRTSFRNIWSCRSRAPSPPSLSLPLSPRLSRS